MVSQVPRRSHPGVRAGRRRVLYRVAAAAALALALLAFVALWLLPVLGQHGDLNALVERLVRSVLAVPVQIDRVETDALSEFSITRVESVAAEAEGRFQFRCERLSVFYRPLELLLDLRVRELIAHRPSVFLDLDRDLSGIVRLPRRPSGPGGFELDRFRIVDGRLAVRLGGRDLVLDGLQLDTTGLGGAGKLFFDAQARLAGARVSARGNLLRLFGEPVAPVRYVIEAARVEVDDLDLEPLVHFLGRAALTGSGRLSLEGNATGVWPEKVELRLSSRLREASAAAGRAPRLLGGEGQIEVSAAAFGELDRIEFQVSFEAEAGLVPLPQPGEAGPPAPGTPVSPRRERVSFAARGEFDKRPEGSAEPRLKIEEGSLKLEGLAEARGGGTITFGPAQSSLDLAVRWPPFPLDRLSERPLPAPFGALARGLEGELGVEARILGTLARPRFSIDFTLPGGAVRLGRDLRIEAPLEGKVELSLPDREGEARVEFDVRGSLEAAKLSVPALRARGALALGHGMEGDGSGERRLRLDAEVWAKEIGIGRVVEAPGESPLALTLEARIAEVAEGRKAGLDLRIDTPSFGPVAARGTIESGAGERWSLGLEVLAPSIPHDRFLGVYLRDPLREKLPLLEGASFSGESSLSGRIEASGKGWALEGTIRSDGLGADLAKGRLSETRYSIPFRIGPFRTDGGEHGKEAPGFIEIGRLEAPGLALRALAIPFTLAGGADRLDRRTVLEPVFGGAVDLDRLDLRPAGGEGERLRLSVRARDLRLEEITPLLDLPAIGGRALLTVDDLSFSGERLLIDGRLLLDLFGGQVELRGLSIEHPLQPYRVFRLDRGEARDLDLGRLGRRFRFGIVSGVLQGWIQDLVATGSEVAGFEADFQTVRKKGVAQYINKGAIESIHRILAGPFGTIEELFFSRFRYAGFGFHASLRDGRFRLKGKRRSGGVEYLMWSRWYQFPRVSIINTRPDIDYDWQVIFENLKGIYRNPESL